MYWLYRNAAALGVVMYYACGRCDGNYDYSVVRGSDVLLLNDNRSDESPRRCPSPTRNISSLCLCLAEPTTCFRCRPIPTLVLY